VGTGGATPYAFGAPLPNSRVRLSGPYGVLALTLHADAYEWRFITADGTVMDAGSDTCVP
jgi:hypothetical protein